MPRSGSPIRHLDTVGTVRSKKVQQDIDDEQDIDQEQGPQKGVIRLLQECELVRNDCTADKNQCQNQRIPSQSESGKFADHVSREVILSFK